MANGYGIDLWAKDEIQTGRFARGIQALAQALYRRAITPFGALLDEAGAVVDYGIGLPRLIGASETDLSAASVEAQIKSEFLKDDRVRLCEASVSLAYSADGLIGLTAVVDVTPHDSATNFRLTITVSQARTILEVS